MGKRRVFAFFFLWNGLMSSFCVCVCVFVTSINIESDDCSNSLINDEHIAMDSSDDFVRAWINIGWCFSFPKIWYLIINSHANVKRHVVCKPVKRATEKKRGKTLIGLLFDPIEQTVNSERFMICFLFFSSVILWYQSICSIYFDRKLNGNRSLVKQKKRFHNWSIVLNLTDENQINSNDQTWRVLVCDRNLILLNESVSSTISFLGSIGTNRRGGQTVSSVQEKITETACIVFSFVCHVV